MSALKVTYFDFSGSRGEEVRLALAMAGQEFTDNRLPRGDFAQIKRDLPFGNLPVFEMEGHGVFAQSNAILRLVGRLYGLHPEDIYEAARHDAVLEAGEEFRQRIAATIGIANDDERKAARQKLAGDYIPQWAMCIDRWIGAGPFVGGAKPNVADIKLYMIDRWISGGNVDHISGDVFDGFAKLKAVAKGIATHPAVIAWQQAPH